MIDLLSRDPNGGGEMLGHYFTPILIVLRSEFLWGSVTTFKDAVLAADQVIFLLLVVLLVTAANSVVLMQNKYDTGDFYTDNQFETFLNALGTMFVFVISGENYVEAITTSLQDNYLFFYIAFFAICTILGMFFISALLIEQFQSTFLQSASFKHTKQRVRGWLALSATYVMWTRHAIRGERHMNFARFVDLMMQQGRSNPEVSTPQWLYTVRARTLSLAEKVISDSDSVYEKYHGACIEILCHVTAEMHLDTEFSQLIDILPGETDNLMQAVHSSGASTSSARMSGIAINSITYFRASLGQLRGCLKERFQKHQEPVLPGLDKKDKSRFQEPVLPGLDKKDKSRFQDLTVLPGLEDETASERSESQLSALPENDFKKLTRLAKGNNFGSPDVSFAERRRYNDMSYSQFYEKLPNAIDSRAKHDVDGYCRRSRTDSVRSKLAAVRSWHGLSEEYAGQELHDRIVGLLELRVLHIWRFLWLFQYVQEYVAEEDLTGDEDMFDTDGFKDDSSLSIREFERLHVLSELSAKLCASPELRQEAYCVQLMRDIDDLHDALADGQGDVYDEEDRSRIGTVQHEDIERTIAKLKKELKSIKKDFYQDELRTSRNLFVATGDLTFVLQLCSWLNIVTVALYGTPVSDTIIDVFIMLFPLLNLMEIVITIQNVGYKEYYKCKANPAHFLPRFISVGTTAASIVLGFPFHIVAQVSPDLWGISLTLTLTLILTLIGGLSWSLGYL